MSDQTIKRIVEVFAETDLKANTVSAELKQVSVHAKKAFEHLTEDAVALLVWDLLPVRNRPAKSTVKEVLKALSNIDKYLKEK